MSYKSKTVKKTIISSIFVILILLGLNILPITTVHAETTDNLPWDPKDEGDHSPCGYEIWCYHAFLTLDNGQKWDAAASFVCFMNKTRKGYTGEGSSFCRIRHWNRQTGKFYDNIQVDKFPGPFHTTKDVMNLVYYNNTAVGKYPDYRFHCEDDKDNIVTNMQCHAISSPCWLLKEATKGVVPWGLSGTGRAYFIPRMQVIGNISINGTLYNFTGVAYLEHDFADIDFGNPMKIYSLKDLRTNLKLIRSVGKWCVIEVSKLTFRNPPSLYISTDYFLGWSWSWIALDNGWSVVMFRPTVAQLVENFVPVFLYLTKDGVNYTEIGCAYWKNINVAYIEKLDLYIPLVFNVTGYKEDIKLDLAFSPTTDMTQAFNGGSGTFYCCGNVTGRYTDKENNITLKGLYSIEQTRMEFPLVKLTRHMSIDIETTLPPKGLSISIKRVSHLFGIERYLKIQLRPKLDIEFYIKRAPDT